LSLFATPAGRLVAEAAGLAAGGGGGGGAGMLAALALGEAGLTGFSSSELISDVDVEGSGKNWSC
jgi:hypothetical protein